MSQIEWNRPTWYFGMTPKQIIICKALAYVLALVWLFVRDGGAP